MVSASEGGRMGKMPIICNACIQYITRDEECVINLVCVHKRHIFTAFLATVVTHFEPVSMYTVQYEQYLHALH